MRSLKCLVPVIILGSALSIPALAADLGTLASPQQQLPDQQMEFGNSWYLRGDIGAVLESNPKISNDLNLISDSARKANYSVDLGFGYKLNSWLRVDIFAEQRNTKTRSGVGGSFSCPTGSVINPGGLTTSLTYSNCDVNGFGKLAHWNALANVYADLGNWGGVTPYIGFGAGLSHSTVTGYTTATLHTGGAAYNPVVVDALTGVSTTYPSYGATASGKAKNQLAWNVMAGIGYALTDHAIVDVGYRFLNLGGYTGIADHNGNVIKHPLTSHEVRMGVRYMID